MSFLRYWSLVKFVPVASLHPTPPKSKLRDALNRCILQRQNKLCPLFHNQRRKILMVYFHILYADTEVFTVTISSSNSLQISYSTAALKFTCATTEGIRFTKHQYQCNKDITSLPLSNHTISPFPSPFHFSDNLAIPTGGEVHGGQVRLFSSVSRICFRS